MNGAFYGGFPLPPVCHFVLFASKKYHVANRLMHLQTEHILRTCQWGGEGEVEYLSSVIQ